MLASIKGSKYAELKLVTNSILKTVECTICLDILSDPVSVGCGHFFCRNCITCLLKTKFRAPCPLCSKSFTKRCVQEASQRQLIVKSVIDLVSTVKGLVEPEDSKKTELTTAEKPDILEKNGALDETASDFKSSRKRKSDEQDQWKKDSFASFERIEAENSTSDKEINSKAHDVSLERRKRRKSSSVLNQTKDRSTDFVPHRNDEMFDSENCRNKKEVLMKMKESEKNVNSKNKSLQNCDMEDINLHNVPIVKVIVQSADFKKNGKQDSESLFIDEKKKDKEKVEFKKSVISDAKSHNSQKKKFFKINKSKIRKLLAASKANIKPLTPENNTNENDCGDPLTHGNISVSTKTIHGKNEALHEIVEKEANPEHFVEQNLRSSVAVGSLEQDKSSTAVHPFKQDENYSTHVNECTEMEVNLCADNESVNDSQSTDLVAYESNIGITNNLRTDKNNSVLESFQDGANPIEEDAVVEEIPENKPADSSFSKSPGWSRLRQMNKDFHPKTFPLLDIIHKNKLLMNSTTLNPVEQCADISLQVVPPSSELSIFSSQKSIYIPPTDSAGGNFRVENVEESPIHGDDAMNFETTKNDTCGEEDLFNDGPVEEADNKLLSIPATENCSGATGAQKDLIDASAIIPKQFQVEKFSEFLPCSNARLAEKQKTNSSSEIKTPKFTRLSRNKNGFNKSPLSGVEMGENDALSGINLSTKFKDLSRKIQEEGSTKSVPTSTIESVSPVEKCQNYESEYSKRSPSKENETIHDVPTMKMASDKKDDEDDSTALQGSTAPFIPINECVVDSVDHEMFDTLVSNDFPKEDKAKNENSQSSKDQTVHKRTSKLLKKRKKKFALRPMKHAKTIRNETNISDKTDAVISYLIESEPKCYAKDQQVNTSTVAMKCSSAEYDRDRVQSVEKSASADNPYNEKIQPTEKTKVVKRICLTLEEIESYFQKSSYTGKCEVATVPLPFSDFKLELNVSDETLNVSVLKVIKSQQSNGSEKFFTDDKSNDSSKQRNEVQTQFPETSKSFNDIITTNNTMHSNSFHYMPKDLPRSAKKNGNVSCNDASSNKDPGQNATQFSDEVEGSGISQSFVVCSVGRELCKTPDDLIKDVNVVNREIESCFQQPGNVETFEDFNECESQVSDAKNDSFDYKTHNTLLESKETENIQKLSPEVQKSDDHPISPVRKNDETIADSLFQISEKPCVKNVNKTIECLDSQNSENSLDINLWPTLSDRCSKPSNDYEQNYLVNDSQRSSSRKSPYPMTISNYQDGITRNVKSPVFSDEMKTKRSSRMDAKNKFVPDLPDIELSEDIDPFGDTGEFYKRLTSQEHDRLNFENMIKETDDYASDPDMQFAKELVGPLKEVAREMALSKAQAENSVGNRSNILKDKHSRKSGIVSSETISPSQRQRPGAGKKNKRFKRITQADSSDEDDMPTQPYPDKYVAEEHCQVPPNDSSRKLQTTSRYRENDKILADFDPLDDVENGMDASLQCLTLDSDVPSSVADKMKREIEMMNEKLGKLKRAINENNDDSCSISSDDEIIQFHNLESSTHSEKVRESDENSDLDLFTEQIPPTPPKYDGNPIN